MTSRRQFLIFLATAPAMPGALPSARGQPADFVPLQENPDLYLHNGWVLRIDDPVDNRIVQ